MSTQCVGQDSPFAAASEGTYNPDTKQGTTWVDVLVDCPGAQGLFTYRLPEHLVVHPGDILSVPFGAQQVGGVAIQCSQTPPSGLEPDQVRDIEAVISAGFFPPSYWSLLNRVADYYCTSLMQVVRVALPPGLLARSQRRVRILLTSSLPPEALSALSPAAQQLLTLLQASKTGEYSWQFLQRQVKAAYRGLQELIKLGWAENYLEPPATVRPKLRQAVTLVSTESAVDLSPRQEEILNVLKRQGGEMWLADLLQLCRTTSPTLKTMAKKGCLLLQPREVLRTEMGVAIAADLPKALTPDQTEAVAQIIQLSGFSQVLLHGVTGSGKTEVYLQAIAPVLQRQQAALVLVPEIGLTPQLTDRFRARFGNQVCVYHSALSDGERYDTWRQMLSGNAQIIIGTRSAVFSPLPNLGLIILDEEHDSSFKQDQPAPCYHARTVALWRAELEHCPLVLGSATPSLESWVSVQAARQGTDNLALRSEDALPDLPPDLPPNLPSFPDPTRSPASPPTLYLTLPERVHARPLPPIEIVDMREELRRGNRSVFSRSLADALNSLRSRHQQGILFIHRRGHSTFVSCRSCGYVMVCPNCDVALSYHHVHAEANPLLRCHYCNHGQTVPKTCPDCDSTYFKHFGSGTQRVAQALEQQFPDLRLLRFDSDTTRTKGSHRALLTQFAQGDADVLIGTQMLTKGIDLPQVTLVGVVAADGLLHFADYRASERAFQTLTQVAGRCGRGNEPGRVIVQTYAADHPVIQAVQCHEYKTFVNTELQQRADLNYPPYGRLILLRFSSTDPVAVQTAAERIAEMLAKTHPEGMDVLGPAPATVLRVARRYRWQLLLKVSRDSSVALPDVAELRALCPTSVSLTVDVDPLTLM